MYNLQQIALLYFWTVPYVLALTLCFISYSQMKFFTRKARLLAKFPSVPALPIIGGIWLLLRNPSPEGAKDAIAYARKRYGRHFCFWMSHKPYVIIMDAKSSQRVLSGNYGLSKGSDYNKYRWLFGNGLITAIPSIWRRDRKLLGPAFNYQTLDGFLSIFNKNAKTMVAILEKKFQENKGQDLDIHLILCRAMMDSISETALGHPSNFQGDLESEFLKAVHMALENIRTKTLKPYFCLPILRNIVGIPYQEKFCGEMFKKYVDEAIKYRMQFYMNNKPETVPGESLPFIDALLFHNPGEVDITGNICSIFAAGFETAASTMNYLLHLLANNPDCLAKVQAELDSIYGDNPNREVELGDMTELKYMEMCIKETLRLYPPVPCFFRQADADIELDDGLTIPQGTDILFPLYELHRDPEHFPDPEKFDPDRFLPDNCATRHPYSYIPFSAGPRNCVGMRYAMVVVKATLSHLLRKFTVTTTLKYEDINVVYGVVLEPSPPVRVALHERSSSNSNSPNVKDNCKDSTEISLNC